MSLLGPAWPGTKSYKTDVQNRICCCRMVLQSRFVQIDMALIFDFREGLPRTLLYAGLEDYPGAIVLRMPTLYGFHEEISTCKSWREAEDGNNIHLDHFEMRPTYVQKSEEANWPGGQLANWPASRLARQSASHAAVQMARPK